jgi:glutamate/aspartate transport system permease protein
VLIQWVTHADRPPQIGADRSAYVTFILFEGAYFCEIMRAGIQSIPRGQVGAAYAVGLNYWQAMRYIILPQAFRNMLPVLLTQTIILFQDTSLVSLLNVTDFIGAIGKLGQSTGHLIEGYAFAAPVYFLICYLLSLAVKGLQKKIAIVR